MADQTDTNAPESDPERATLMRLAREWLDAWEDEVAATALAEPATPTTSFSPDDKAAAP